MPFAEAPGSGQQQQQAVCVITAMLARLSNVGQDFANKQSLEDQNSQGTGTGTNLIVNVGNVKN